MKLDGFSVDSISSFCQHFYLPDLLEAIDSQVIFSKWLNDVLTSGGMEDAVEAQIRQMKEVFAVWINGADDGENSISGTVSEKQANNKELLRHFKIWRTQVSAENHVRYDHLCFIFATLFEIGRHIADEQDMQMIEMFLRKQNLFKKKKLSLCTDGYNRVYLYYGNDLVAELPCAHSSWAESMQVISIVQHPDTGYLAITKTGELVNSSAFMIKPPDRSVVKIQMNQIAYVILLEDGSIIHNLRFSELPSYPVKNISLQGEQLNWIAMD